MVPGVHHMVRPNWKNQGLHDFLMYWNALLHRVFVLVTCSSIQMQISSSSSRQMQLANFLDGPYDSWMWLGGINKAVSCTTQSGTFLVNKFHDVCILLTISAFQIVLSRLISSNNCRCDVNEGCGSARYASFCVFITFEYILLIMNALDQNNMHQSATNQLTDVFLGEVWAIYDTGLTFFESIYIISHF